jgi:hypothetical protein
MRFQTFKPFQSFKWLMAYGLSRMVRIFQLYTISDQPYAISGTCLASESF